MTFHAQSAGRKLIQELGTEPFPDLRDFRTYVTSYLRHSSSHFNAITQLQTSNMAHLRSVEGHKVGRTELLAAKP
jgi:hypothetical protein